MSGYLVIKCNVPLKPDKLNELYKTFINQTDNGVILLPPYCNVEAVPDNMTVYEDSVIKVLEV